MNLNIKKFFKKIACLGGAAFMAFSLCSPLVKATPGANQAGILSGTVGITAATLDQIAADGLYTITPESSLTYNGSAQQLITSVTQAHANDGTTLWLRISESNTDTTSGVADAVWVQYENAQSLANANLKKTDAKTYYIYKYIEGGSNYNNATYPSSS